MKTIRFLIFVLLAAASSTLWGRDLTFSDHSQITEGKWVKIGTPKNGIYAISYAKLREMGFSDPSKVRVWGEGGEMYPRDFINATTLSRQIPDTMPQIACMHRDNKLYFYGRGPENLSWEYDDTYESGGLFVNKGQNIYTKQGVYFLSDQGPEKSVKAMDVSSSVTSNPMKVGQAYFYHEKDITQGNSHSGQTFWGEAFAATDKLRQKFQYTMPGLVDTLPGALNVRFCGLSWGASYLEIAVDGNDIASSYIEPRPDAYCYVKENSINRYTLPKLKEKGEIELYWSQISLYQAQAYLDYLLMTYPRRLQFEPGEKQFAVQTVITDTPAVTIPSDNDVMVWDVTDNRNPRYLVNDKGIGLVPYGPRQLVYFRSGEALPEPTVIESVQPEDFRARLLNENPEYIILTTEAFRTQAEKLADFHRQHDGTRISVVTNKDCYNSFSAGRPEPMAYRTMLRMVYEKKNNRLRGVLLYGPQRSDVRGLNGADAPDALIVYQNPSADRVANWLALTDIYGMFSDYLRTYIETEQMSIAVASLPVLSESEAERYYNKVVNYTFDDSRAYWLERVLLTADDKDGNSHLDQSNILGNELNRYSGNNLTLDKVHVGEFGYPEVKRPIYNAFNEGFSLAEYIGHGSCTQLGHDVAIFNSSDMSMINNRRLGLMAFASCETSLYELGWRGVAEHLVLSTNSGLIGSLGTVRTAFSGDNFAFMRNFGRMSTSLYDRSTGRCEELGEIVRRTKNETSGYLGKYKYHLICDPMLRYIRPTLKFAVSETPSVVKPGDEYTFSGSVTTPAGMNVQDFKGEMVMKWYEPSYISKAKSKIAKDPGNVEVEYDHTAFAVESFNVADGRFSIKANVPEMTRSYIGDTIRVSVVAYDPDKRLGGSWNFNVVVDSTTSTTPGVDNQAPVIESMMAEGQHEGDMLPSAFTLVADVTDNTGIRIDEKAIDGPLMMTLDGKTMPTGIANFVKMENGAKRMILRYPMEALGSGRHSVILSVTDYAGNITRQEFSFEVGTSEQITAPLLAERACREQATFTLEADVLQSIGDNAQLVVTNALGKIIRIQNWSMQGENVWKLNDTKNVQVAPGLYKAFVRFTDSYGRSAVTQGVYGPVLGKNSVMQ